MTPEAVKWVEDTCKLLADDASRIIITYQDYENDRLVITVTAHGDEMGRVIGRYGDTIKSLRTIAYCLGMKTSKKKTSILVDGMGDFIACD